MSPFHVCSFLCGINTCCGHLVISILIGFWIKGCLYTYLSVGNFFLRSQYLKKNLFWHSFLYRFDFLSMKIMSHFREHQIYFWNQICYLDLKKPTNILVHMNRKHIYIGLCHCPLVLSVSDLWSCVKNLSIYLLILWGTLYTAIKSISWIHCVLDCSE